MNGRVLLDAENTADVGFAVRKWDCDRGLIDRRAQASDETAFGDSYSASARRK